ncbi:hypothetical protein V5F40_02960 [Xanthobacter sp. DSM 14520]|uniref:hypothetical protein n=1 Tax=Xanthobacter autotrophicus (strain ATCC BAA-1158 / Py2) TaxID=78245 RepID=UPI00372C7A36
MLFLSPELLSRVLQVPGPTIRWWRLHFGVAAGYDRRAGYSFVHALELYLVALLTRRGFTARDACAIVVASRENIQHAAHGAGTFVFVGSPKSGGLDIVEASPTAMVVASMADDDDHIAVALDLRSIANRLGLLLLDMKSGEEVS